MIGIAVEYAKIAEYQRFLTSGRSSRLLGNLEKSWISLLRRVIERFSENLFCACRFREILRTGSEYLAFDGQISEMLRFPHSVVGSALSSRTGDGLTRSAWLAWGGGSVLAHLRIPARMYLLGHRKPARASSSIPSAAAHCSSNSVVPRATRTCNIRPALPGKSSHFAYDRNHGHGNGGFSVASGQRSAVWRVS